MTLHSGIYIGHVRHRRREPAHAFRFPMFMVYLDLAEIDQVLSMTRLWGRSRWCPARFRREDYLRRGDLNLDQSVRQCVYEQVGRRPDGPIRMLTHLRYFGYVFNPVTFYYCFDTAERLTAIVAEITNTPWRERHAYVLECDAAEHPGGTLGRGRRGGDSGVLRWRFDKRFHVSPFMPMQLNYDWAFKPPDQSVFVHMNLNRPGSTKSFDATLTLSRQEITPARLRGLLIRFPVLTLRIIARIHFEALRLWIKGARVHPHPRRAAKPGPTAHESRT
jgi:DUF1365 family protein